MSLSRPVKFPLLKLPFLCIKCVIHNSDLFDIIYFTSISNRTRRIVKNSKYPLKEIDVSSNRSRKICMGNRRNWYFMPHEHAYGVALILQRNSPSFLTSRGFDWRGYYLESYTSGNTLDALKMGIDFMIDVFGCTIRYIVVDGNKLSELFGLGISTVKLLQINDEMPVNITDLKYLLETIKVTDEYVFNARIPKGFYCDPQVFKCRELSFPFNHSADWVTLEILCQFDVPVLCFWTHRFSVEDVVSYITHWFSSASRKLEYVQFGFNDAITLESFEIDHLNPMPFCETRRNRCPLNVRGWEKIDISRGKDILRQDGLLATLHAFPKSVLFCVWHKRFPDAVQQ